MSFTNSPTRGRQRTMEWAVEAKCKGQDPNLFYPRWRGDLQRAAVKLCASCPVQGECLEAALSVATPQDFGVWGGLREHDRRQLRRDPGRKSRAIAAAYLAGRRAREEAS